MDLEIAESTEGLPITCKVTLTDLGILLQGHKRACGIKYKEQVVHVQLELITDGSNE